METYAIIISVILLCVLCLLKVNVMLSLLISCLVGGLIGGLSVTETFQIIYDGFANNAETALSYILLGTFACSISYTGIDKILTQKLVKIIKGKGKILLLIMAAISCLSQNIIPIHIAFIPIMIPPLLKIMDKLNIDRRSASCALAFGLEMPYIVFPLGFGMIFQGVVAKNMTDNGMEVSVMDVTKVNWIIGIAMLIGLLIAIFITYRKPRNYNQKSVDFIFDKEDKACDDKNSIYVYIVTIISIIVTVIIQVIFKSLPLAALCGVVILFLFGAVPLKSLDEQFANGIKEMGYISFIMLIAGGFAEVLKEVGGIDQIVLSSIGLMNGNKLIAAFIILFIGLFVTMGIGTSFGTIPILCIIYIPLCMKIGFSTNATILLISAAGALGDAGSPASDTTLGPTCGLNADGKHDHIWDTCVPTFLHYNIPIIILCGIMAQFI